MKGYALAEALRKEADEIATDSRAELVRSAAKDIERLIQENRALLHPDTIEARNALKRCADYGNSTTNAEWSEAATMAIQALGGDE